MLDDEYAQDYEEVEDDQPTVAPDASGYVPYTGIGLDNKIIGLDKLTTELFGLTYDNQLGNITERDYRYGRLIGQHLQTLKTIEKKLGKTDCLHNLKLEYSAKLNFMLVLSKSKDMELLKTLRSAYTYGKSYQTVKNEGGEHTAPKKRKIFGIELPI